MLADVDLRGATKADPAFLSVVLELDDDLWRFSPPRERIAQHYGVPVEQVSIRGQQPSRGEAQ